MPRAGIAWRVVAMPSVTGMQQEGKSRGVYHDGIRPRKARCQILDTEQLGGRHQDWETTGMNTRRQFLITAPLGALGAAAACRGEQQSATVSTPPTTPGAPPTFGTAPV